MANHARDASLMQPLAEASVANSVPIPSSTIRKVDPESRAPFYRWLAQRVPAEAVVFRTNEARVAADTLVAGAGLGFLPVLQAQGTDGLIEVLPPRPDWETPLWLVTHVDLHRTPRIQLFVKALKDDARLHGLD